MTSATIGKTDRNMPDHFASAVIALHAAEQLEAGADDLGQTVKDFGKVTARSLLDGHGNGEEAQILHVQPLGHFLERVADIPAIGAFIGDDAHLCCQRIRDFFRHDMVSAEENG